MPVDSIIQEIDKDHVAVVYVSKVEGFEMWTGDLYAKTMTGLDDNGQAIYTTTELLHRTRQWSKDKALNECRQAYYTLKRKEKES